MFIDGGLVIKDCIDECGVFDLRKLVLHLYFIQFFNARRTFKTYRRSENS